jgi:uncharacterized protein (UPF0212 family)
MTVECPSCGYDFDSRFCHINEYGECICPDCGWEFEGDDEDDCEDDQ